jgi:hypothetical protein
MENEIRVGDAGPMVFVAPTSKADRQIRLSGSD